MITFDKALDNYRDAVKLTEQHVTLFHRGKANQCVDCLDQTQVHLTEAEARAAVIAARPYANEERQEQTAQWIWEADTRQRAEVIHEIHHGVDALPIDAACNAGNADHELACFPPGPDCDYCPPSVKDKAAAS